MTKNILLALSMCLLFFGCTSLEVVEPIENISAMDQFGFKWSVEGYTRDYNELAGNHFYITSFSNDRKEEIPLRIVKMKVENIDKKFYWRSFNTQKIFLVFEAAVDSILRRSDLYCGTYRGNSNLILLRPVTFTKPGRITVDERTISGTIIKIPELYEFGISYPVIEGNRLAYIVIDDNTYVIELRIP